MPLRPAFPLWRPSLAASCSMPFLRCKILYAVIPLRVRMNFTFANGSSVVAYSLKHRIDVFAELYGLTRTPLKVPIYATVNDGLDRWVTPASRRLDQVARECSRLVPAIFERVHQHRDGKGLHFGRREVLGPANRESHPECKTCEHLSLQLGGRIERNTHGRNEISAHVSDTAA